MSDNSLVIGLTGNIATGKSTILSYLAAKGAAIIDADKIAHRSMEPTGKAYGPIVRTFGQAILNEDGTINRGKLGNIVFSNPMDLGKLEKIVHPQVFEMSRQEIENATSPVIILEAVKLLEAGLTVTLCDEVWVVTSSTRNQTQRLVTFRGMSEERARQIISIQPPQAAKVNQADRVIDNDGSLEDLYAQLDAAWDSLIARYPARLQALTKILARSSQE
jgi:dephospho-CoA kinase